MQCNLERSEDKARWHVSKGAGQGYGGWGGICAGVLTMPLHPQLTLLLVLEDRLHRQLTYDLLPSRLTGDQVVAWGSGGRWLVPPFTCPLFSRQCPGPRCGTSALRLPARGRRGALQVWKGAGWHELPTTPMSPTHPLQDDRTKLAAFLETTFLKYRGTQA